MQTEKKRIWELDAARGICILGMIGVHLIYDLASVGDGTIELPAWYSFAKNYGHILFILISGICATLSSHSFQRGIVVFGAGLLVSYVTFFAELVMGMEDVRIWFGILHMLGACMMLYPLFKKLPIWAAAILGAAFVGLGLWMEQITVPADFLFPLGLCSETVYAGNDFFPLFPGLGWFLLGTVLGKTIYKKQKTLLPQVKEDHLVLRFLRSCGRHSLAIYLLHQPILIAGLLLIAQIF